MRKRVGHLEIATIAAERSKFTAPMVLVHGLWCTGSIWHRLMGYLAHRGWDCHAVNLRGRSTTGATPLPATMQPHIGDHLDDLNTVLRACDAPPVVVGHDFGGLLALSRSLAPARAVVAVAPLIPQPSRDTALPGFTALRTRMEVRWRNRLPPPRGENRRSYFGSVAPRPIVPEAATLARDLADPELPFPIGPSAPTLILAGEVDRVTPSATAAKIAAMIGADLETVARGGHALPWEDGWQERVTDIHRWLIRTLGDSLLAMLDEEDTD